MSLFFIALYLLIVVIIIKMNYNNVCYIFIIIINYLFINLFIVVVYL